MPADLVVSPMTPAQTRVIDPILSTVALGYKNADFIGSVLFPRVPVLISGGQVLQFGKEAFKQYNIRRAPGGRTARISFGYLGVPYALFEDAVDVPVPREMMRDAAIMPGIDLGTRAVNLGMRVVLLNLERDQAAIALNPANYDDEHQVALSGTSQWSNAACDPVPQINGYKDAIRETIGMYPNTLALSATAFTALRDNQALRDHFKYTSAQSITTEMIAKYFDLDQVVVGKALTSDDAGDFSDIWGDNAVMAYVPKENEQAQEVPSYGYTYTMTGHPLVEVPRWDPDTKSWVYGIAMERVPVTTGITAGYLIQNPA
jgi:hypothetical protein